ncbi:MAG: Hsp70 family protein [Patescibacteria group bacterium]
MKEKITYGLDFGTSNTAIVANYKGILRPIPLSSDGSLITPTVLYFPPDGRVYKFGDEAVKEYLARKMKGRFMQSLKSFLPSESFSGTYISGFGHRYLHDLIALIFSEVKKRADILIGENIRSVVIGIPAKFVNELDNSSRNLAEERLRMAADMVGFKEVNFILEPIAAAYYYETLLNSSETVLVGDFGGGTTDFTIMNLSPNGNKKIDRKDDILATSGIPIAGNNFTSDLMRNKLLKYFGQGSKFKSWDKWLEMPVHILQMICKWENLAFMRTPEYRKTINMLLNKTDDYDGISRLHTLIEDNLGYTLFQSIERAKIELSGNVVSKILFSESNIKIDEEVSREEYDYLIGYMYEKIDETIQEMLKVSSKNPKDIDAVFLTGGTSFTPLIKDYFTKKFGKNKIKSKDNFTDVANGLAASMV